MQASLTRIITLVLVLALAAGEIRPYDPAHGRGEFPRQAFAAQTLAEPLAHAYRPLIAKDGCGPVAPRGSGRRISH